MNSLKTPVWDKVEKYGVETMRMIRREYPWYRPSPSVHTLCLHGKDVMGSRELGPGFYTESAQESFNKKDRYNREHHARKCSRSDNLRDIFQQHMAYGDAVFSSKMTMGPRENLPTFPELNDLYKENAHSENEMIESDYDVHSESEFSDE